MSVPMDSKVNIVPSLRYADAAAAIDWLCEAFGFERHMVVPGENGTIDHAQLDFGNGMLMLGSGGGHERPIDRLVRPPRNRDEPRPSSIYVIVKDADAHYARDARVIRQHVAVAPQHLDDAGRVLLGLPPEGLMLSMAG
jgi:uncharacterized glyoxalase superfamily protein PhnB